MSEAVRNLEPKEIWNKFADLNAVPRPSKKEERVIAFMKKFGQELNLETIVDEVGNVIIKKPATKGLEDRKTVVMQSHLDMVHQKNSDTVFDFDTQGIEMYVDGDWVKAKGTTLGADNGLGVATIMAILESSEIAHPALEALFTIDEETGMTGAMGLKGGLLEGDILLNLDTEEDDEIGVGCAGGIDITAVLSYNEELTPTNTKAFEISITGLNGGHSGMDITKGLGNANVFLTRLLYKTDELHQVRVAHVEGGSLRNAIPREAFATIVVPNAEVDAFKELFVKRSQEINNEYKQLEQDMSIALTPIETPKAVMCLETQKNVFNALYATHNGVYRMSPAIEDLVETSNNLARIEILNQQVRILCLTRSSVESGKIDLVNKLTAVFELAGLSVELSGSYPGWTPKMDAEILQVVRDTYVRLNNSEPHVAACHAGLECGILGTHYPEMEMISFGPNIKGAHSPDERTQISSVQKYWKFVLEILKQIPHK